MSAGLDDCLRQKLDMPIDSMSMCQLVCQCSAELVIPSAVFFSAKLLNVLICCCRYSKNLGINSAANTLVGSPAYLGVLLGSAIVSEITVTFFCGGAAARPLTSSRYLRCGDTGPQ